MPFSEFTCCCEDDSELELGFKYAIDAICEPDEYTNNSEQ